MVKTKVWIIYQHLEEDLSCSQMKGNESDVQEQPRNEWGCSVKWKLLEHQCLWPQGASFTAPWTKKVLSKKQTLGPEDRPSCWTEICTCPHGQEKSLPDGHKTLFTGENYQKSCWVVFSFNSHVPALVPCDWNICVNLKAQTEAPTLQLYMKHLLGWIYCT